MNYKKTNHRIIFGISLLIFSLIIIGLLLFFSRNFLFSSFNSSITEGKVITFKPLYKNDFIRFEYNIKNQLYEIEEYLYFSQNEYDIGDNLQIKYNLNNPNFAIIIGTEYHLIILLIILVLPLILIILSIGILRNSFMS